MSWRDRMEKASWRGVPFSVKSHDLSGGHRLAKHLFAGKPGQYAEDIAPAPEAFSVTAFVFGADYDRDRENLLRELRKGGIGELIHPWLGKLRVKCETWTLSESGEQGGQATFSLSFVQSTEQRYPASATDSKSKTESEADALNESAAADFAAGFSVASLPAFVADTAAEHLSAVSDAISGATSFLFGQSDDIATLAVQLSDLKTQAATLVGTPGALATSVLSSVELLSKASKINTATFSLFDFGEDMDDYPQTTPARVAQQQNKKQLNLLVQSAAVAVACKEAVGIDFETHAAAIAHRDKILEALDNICERDISDAAFLRMDALRLNLSKAINSGSANLPRIRRVEVLATIPALVLSQRLYGTAANVDDIVARNNIEHPGFIPGGSELSVLVSE